MAGRTQQGIQFNATTHVPSSSVYCGRDGEERRGVLGTLGTLVRSGSSVDGDLSLPTESEVRCT